jgi:hypothetical protein
MITMKIINDYCEKNPTEAYYLFPREIEILLSIDLSYYILKNCNQQSLIATVILEKKSDQGDSFVPEKKKDPLFLRKRKTIYS